MDNEIRPPGMVQVEWRVAKACKLFGLNSKIVSKKVKKLTWPFHGEEQATDQDQEDGEIEIEERFYIPIWAHLLLQETVGRIKALSLSGTKIKKLRASIDKTLYDDDAKISIMMEHLFESGSYRKECLECLGKMRENHG
jgi:hypothetical protein